MADTVYQLTPQNPAVVEGVQNLGKIEQPQLQYDPNSLGSIQASQPTQTLPPFSPPIDHSAPPVQLGQTTQPDAETAFYQQQLQSLQKPWYKEHPIVSRVLAGQQYGLGGLFAAPQIANQLVQQNRLKAIQGLQQAATRQNSYNIGTGLQEAAGLGPATPGSAFDKDTLNILQEMAKVYGAPTAMRAIASYNQDLSDYNTRKQDIETDYHQRKATNQLTPEEKYYGMPLLPDKPQLNVEGLNPYLAAGQLAGVTGASTTAAETGAKAGQEAASTQAREKEAEARLNELHQQHEDTVGLKRAELDQNRLFKQADIGLKQDEAGDRRKQILAMDADHATQRALQANQEVQSLNAQMLKLLDSLGSDETARKSPRFKALDKQYRQSQANFEKLSKIADEKQKRYESYDGSSTSVTPQAQTPTPIRQTVSQGGSTSSAGKAAPAPAPPKMKIRINRADAQKRGLLPNAQ